MTPTTRNRRQNDTWIFALRAMLPAKERVENPPSAGAFCLFCVSRGKKDCVLSPETLRRVARYKASNVGKRSVERAKSPRKFVFSTRESHPKDTPKTQRIEAEQDAKTVQKPRKSRQTSARREISQGERPANYQKVSKNGLFDYILFRAKPCCRNKLCTISRIKSLTFCL